MSGIAGSRKCHVIKTESEEFEFFLKVDEARKGQIITAVTKDGPAHRAGLRDGDRVIEINCENVEDKDHNAVVAKIRESIPSNEITFLVVELTHDPKAIKTTNSGPKSNSESAARPRICKIKKKNDSFGFFLEAHGDSNPGHFIQKVTKGGAADGTGLRNGDRVIAVGKTNVEEVAHAQVVTLIKKSGTKVSLLVIDEESYQDLKKKNIPITEKMAKGRGSTSSSKNSKPAKQPSKSKAEVQSTFEHSGKVRVTHVFKHPDRGYGFYLRSKKGSAGEYIGDIEEGGAADICGLRNDDRVVAVNGKPIIGLPHTDVISLIKAKRCQVVFVVMDDGARRKFEDQADFPSDDDIVRTHPHIIRSVKLEKSESGYGLYLKMEKGCPFHIISDIEEGGAANRAGLQDDEIVIAVEGSSVLTDTHEDCVQKIKNAGEAVEMMVCNRKAAEFLLKVGVAVGLELYKEWPGEDELKVPFLEKPKGSEKKADGVVETVAAVAVAASLVNDQGVKPRLCRVVKRDDGFGFFLKDDKGHYLINVEDDGPAYHAGILEYDRIVEINGDNVEKITHNDVVSKIRQSGNEVTFLVVNKEEDKYFRERGILIAASLLTEGDLDDDHKPRLCTLKRTTGGYGFHLMGDSDQPGQYIREIVKGEAADVAGLRNGDRIIEVNGDNVMNESHDDIVKKIKQKNDEVTFLVIDQQGEAYYKQREIAIVASLVVAKSIVENEKKSEKDAESVGHSSVSSSIVEAHVHQEDTNKEEETAQEEREERDANVAEVVATVAAVKAVEEVIDEIKEKQEEEAKEEREEEIEKAMEEVAEQITEVLEEEAKKEEEMGIVEKVAVAAVASAVVEEIVENHREEKVEDRVEETIEEIAEAAEDARKEEEDEKAEAVEEAIEAIQDKIDGANEEEGLDAGEKLAAGIIAAAVVNEVVENANEDAESDRKSSSSEEEETLKEEVKELVEENEGVAEVLENHVEGAKEEEDTPQEALKEAIEDSLKNLDNVEKVNGEVSDHEDEVEREAQLEPEFVAPAVIAAAAVAAARSPSPEPVRAPTPPPILSNHVEEPKTIEAEIKVEGKSKSVEATIIIQKEPTPAPVVIVAAKSVPESPKPLAAVLTEQTEAPKLRPTPEPQKVPFTWGQHNLRPVNRPPPKPVAAAVAEVVEEKSEEDAAPARSSVAAMRAAIERRNRENQRDALANEIKDELAQLSKQNGGASKRIQMFGGSVKMPPKSNAPPQKQKSWTGEGMTIKIVET